MDNFRPARRAGGIGSDNQHGVAGSDQVFELRRIDWGIQRRVDFAVCELRRLVGLWRNHIETRRVVFEIDRGLAIAKLNYRHSVVELLSNAINKSCPNSALRVLAPSRLCVR